MKEIRLRWLFGLHEAEDGEPLGGGIWFPDTPDNRRDIEILVEEGCAVAGAGSYWMEERQA